MPILTYVTQRPKSNFITRNIIGTDPNTNDNFAIQPPSSKFIPKSIIDTIPNTNKTYTIQRPSSNLSTKVLLVAFPYTNNSLRYPASIFKIYPKKYYWSHS